MNLKRLWGVLALCALAGGAAVGVFWGRGGGPTADGASEAASAAAEDGGALPVAKRRQVTKVGSARAPRGTPEGQLKSETDADGLALSVDAGEDERLMADVVKGLLNELSEAASARDYKRLDELIVKLRALNYGARASSAGSARFASSVKRKVLETLGELGYAGLADLIDFLSDSDQAIASSATELLFKSLDDYRLPDRQRAEAVTAAAEELTDEDMLNRLFNEFLKMRHSVGAAALLQIDSSGTDAAKKLLPRAISAFTGDVSITTAKQLQALVESGDFPDSELDGWFYGREELPFESK